MKKASLRHYRNAGIIRYQNGYTKKDGIIVKPHFKTYPGPQNKKDNRKSILGY